MAQFAAGSSEITAWGCRKQQRPRAWCLNAPVTSSAFCQTWHRRGRLRPSRTPSLHCCGSRPFAPRPRVATAGR
eukprot:7738011-Alexandrium_andersonii.AAC.1